MTRLRLELDSQGDGFVVKLSAPDDHWTAPERSLRRSKPMGFPMPPIEEKASWDDKYADLCDAPDDKKLRRLHLSILQRDSADDAVDQFGSYLFAALFGPSWELATTQFPNATGFDIEILSSADAKLDFVPWEMMARGGKPLIAQAQHSISRLVEPAPEAGTQAGKKPTARVLEIPGRGLFVVGELDELLRPGAEYLAFLGNLASRAANGAAGGAVNTMLMVRSLVSADAAQLEAAVKSFRPNIVHIVAHGTIDNDQPAICLAKLDANRTRQPDPCGPDRLLDLMGRKKPPLPALVVLNACHTADQVDAGDARSFAAALVRGGVAAAVGMAGEVASNACRLFTKALYGALTAKRSLQQAVAEAQYAARLHYEKYARSGEWARPSLFIAAGAEIEFKEDAHTVARLTAVANVRGQGAILCDRYSALRAYEDFIETWGPGSPRILVYEQAAKAPELENKQLGQLGKSHLLYQLKWRALLDGYLPCHVPSHPPAVTPPNNLLLLALKLAETMDEIRGKLDLKPVGFSEALRGAFLVLKLPMVKPEAGLEFEIAVDAVKKELNQRSDIGPNVVDKALRSDIERFLADVKAKCGSMRGVMILLDDLHLYSGYYQHLLRLLNEHGLGTRDAPAPVIATYSSYPGVKGGEDLLKLFNEEAAIKAFTQRAWIEPFPDAPEGRLAYSHYMLSQGFAPSRDPAKQDSIGLVFNWVHQQAKGAPSNLKATIRLLEMARDHGALIAADDEAIFKVIYDAQKGGGGGE